MKYYLFQDLIQRKYPRKLIRFYIISILVHIFVIFTLSEAPMRSSGSSPGKNRQNTTHKAGGFDYNKSRVASSETGINNEHSPEEYPQKTHNVAKSSGKQEIPNRDTAVSSGRTEGEIQGYIYDEMRNNIQGVEIKAINLNSDLTIKTVSDNRGHYSFENLPIGPYHVEVEAVNFSKFSKKDIVLKEGEPLTVDVRLMPLYLSTESTYPTVQGKLKAGETTNSNVPEILAFLQLHPVGGTFSSYVKIRNVVLEDSISIIFDLGFNAFHRMIHSLMFLKTFF